MVYASKLDVEIQSISPAIRELSVEEAESTGYPKNIAL